MGPTPDLRRERESSVYRTLALLTAIGAAVIVLEGIRHGSHDALEPVQLRIDPNSAPGQVLEALPEIGPERARAWMEARSERPIQSAEDLEARVKGIGPETLRRILPYLSFPDGPIPDGKRNP